MIEFRNYISKNVLLGFVGLLGVTTCIGLYLGISFISNLQSELPDPKILLDHQSSVPSIIYSSDGLKIGELFLERRYPKLLKEVNPVLVKAFLAAEDSGFYEHGGVDYRGIFRAGLRFVTGTGQKQGGSTITQQLAKTLLLTKERTIRRKLKDILLAKQIEKVLSKDQILELYLNTIFLGNNSYGVESAAKNYFKKSNKSLSLAQAAMLAGLTPAPSSYAPTTNLKKAKVRQRFVLEQMLKNRFITQEEFASSLNEPIKVFLASSPNTLVAPYFFSEVNKQLENDLSESVKYEDLKKGGYKIYTTLNLRLQQQVVGAAKKHMSQYQKYLAFKGPRKRHGEKFIDVAKKLSELPIREDDAIQSAVVIDLIPSLDAAVVVSAEGIGLLLAEHHRWATRTLGKSLEKSTADFADIISIGDEVGVELLTEQAPKRIKTSVVLKKTIRAHAATIGLEDMELGVDDLPIYALADKEGIELAGLLMDASNGGVLAMIGGRNFKENQFNHATQGKRQVGSSVKPLYYTYALDNGFSPASKIDTPPLVIGDWRPENYSKEFTGQTTLRNSLVHSYNISSIQLFQALGATKVAKIFTSLGLNWPVEDLSVALGSGEATLLQMVSAYSPFAREGSRVLPRYIDRIEDAKGKVILDATSPKLLLLNAQLNSNAASAKTKNLEKDSTVNSKKQAAKPLSKPGSNSKIYSPEAAYVGMRLMRDVIQFGTGTAAAGVSGGAGKTGTTNRYSDAWFLGVAPGLVGGVWMGFDDPKKSLGAGQGTGGKMAAPLWKELMLLAQKVVQNKKWTEPLNISYAKINPETGDLSLDGGGVMVPLVPGTEPSSPTLRHVLGFSAFDALMSSSLGGQKISGDKTGGDSSKKPESVTPSEDTGSLRGLF